MLVESDSYQTCSWRENLIVTPGHVWWNGPIPIFDQTAEAGLAELVKNRTVRKCKPSKIVYRELNKLNNAGHETWCTPHVFTSKVDRTQRRVGYSKYTTGVSKYGTLKSKIKTALEHNYIREWTCQINTRNENPIWRTYAKFKSNLSTEHYLTSLKSILLGLESVSTSLL